jgi:hypothetical protein
MKFLNGCEASHVPPLQGVETMRRPLHEKGGYQGEINKSIRPGPHEIFNVEPGDAFQFLLFK